jgi:hypothetical protein
MTTDGKPDPRWDEVELLHRCLSLHALRGRDELGLSLRPDEALLLDELARFFAARERTHAVADADGPFPARADVRDEVAIDVELRDGDGAFHPGTIRNVSASGLFVASRALLGRGARATFRVIDDHQGREWRFVGEVTWTRPVSEGGGGGLRIVGIPLELRLGLRPRPSRSLPRAA